MSRFSALAEGRTEGGREGGREGEGKGKEGREGELGGGVGGGEGGLFEIGASCMQSEIRHPNVSIIS
jgi:hypothetical protein